MVCHEMEGRWLACLGRARSAASASYLRAAAGHMLLTPLNHAADAASVLPSSANGSLTGHKRSAATQAQAAPAASKQRRLMPAGTQPAVQCSDEALAVILDRPAPLTLEIHQAAQLQAIKGTLGAGGALQLGVLPD